MKCKKPDDLTEEHWSLLQFIAQYKTPFYSDDVYITFSKSVHNRLHFYSMFYRLCFLGYLVMVGFDEPEAGQRQKIFYTLNEKGIRSVEKCTQTDDDYSLFDML